MRNLSYIFGLFWLIPFSLFPSSVALASQLVSLSNNSVSIDLLEENPSAPLPLGQAISADLGSDGVAEIVVAAGPGAAPWVSIYRKDGSIIRSFLAYDRQMTAGLNLAICDLSGDGVAEIILAPQAGGGPHLRVFNNFGQPLDTGGQFIYNSAFAGGVNLACGDLDGQMGAELVTLPGAGGGPHVKIWYWQNDKLKMWQEYFAVEQKDERGLLGAIDASKIFLTTQTDSTNKIFVWEIKNYPQLIDTINFSSDENIFSQLLVRGENIFLLSKKSGTIVDIKNNSSQKNSAVALAWINNEIFTLISAIKNKSIVVDLSEQQLYAYENGREVRRFLISAARLPWHTPVGIHSVLAKIPEVNYVWNYGPGNPNNYDLGLVPYNLRIYPHIYIHYAYWHNNFGQPMSHGCINVDLENAKWIYDWSEVGIPVTVQE